MIVELIIFLVTSLVAYFWYLNKKVQNYFDKAGVRYVPSVPLFGNAMNSSMMKAHVIDDIEAIYKTFPDEKYVGYIEATVPTILIRDPELVKNITVKDFDHFVDHRQFFPEEIDTLFGDSILMMRGEKWRHMRTTLSPAFTGAKMRQMMTFMADISNNIVEYLKVTNSNEVDVLDLMRRYTNDVIATAGFGVQVNSLKDKENEFYMLGQGMFNFTAKQRIALTIALIFPKLAKLLNLELFPKKNRDFFTNVVISTMEFREKNKVERPDMIQLLMEASKGSLKHDSIKEKDNVGFAAVGEELKPLAATRKWTLDELTSQVFIFFVAGFEGSSTALIMSVHELAVNPDVQEKLYQEIMAFKEKNGNLTYDNINELKYLDGVLNESLRKWAAVLLLDRVCTKAYELPPPREGGKPYIVKPGDIVYSAGNSIHMDPKYFPEPHKFDPERFSDENKHKIKPFTFIPFGAGPRNCIASRFAILELKVFLYNLVLNFTILKCAKTTDPIELAPTDVNIRAKGGSWVKLAPRN